MSYAEDMGYDAYDGGDEDEVVDYLEVVTDTMLAILFKCRVPFGNGRTREMEVWLPKSQIEVDEKSKEITMPGWLYRKHFK